MKREFRATPEAVMQAVDVLRAYCEALHVPPPALFGMALALEECGANIVNHAYHGLPGGKFRVSVAHDRELLHVELRDDGPPFDPTAVAPQGRGASRTTGPGGWGLALVRRYTDEIQYRRAGDENVLRLTMRLAPRSRVEAAISTSNPEPAMALDIKILKNVVTSNSGGPTVKVSGSLDTSTAPDLERQLAPILAGPTAVLAFDLTELKFISSAGLRVFAATGKKLKERGGHAAFIGMQPQIKEVFEIIQALPGMSVFKDEAEFDGYLAARQERHLKPEK